LRALRRIDSGLRLPHHAGREDRARDIALAPPNRVMGLRAHLITAEERLSIAMARQ
jgi:hypothetical protein